MNKIFKVVYSKARHMKVVVSEITKSHSNGQGRISGRRKLLCGILILGTLSVSVAYASRTTLLTNSSTRWLYKSGGSLSSGSLANNNNKYQGIWIVYDADDGNYKEVSVRSNICRLNPGGLNTSVSGWGWNYDYSKSFDANFSTFYSSVNKYGQELWAKGASSHGFSNVRDYAYYLANNQQGYSYTHYYSEGEDEHASTINYGIDISHVYTDDEVAALGLGAGTDKNGNNTTGDDKTEVNGKNNNTTGNNDKVTGDGNNTTGNDDTIDGSNNNTTGNNDDIDGNNNNTTGDRDNVTGDGNNTYGNDDDIDGSNNNTTGNNDDIDGNNNNTTGDRDEVTGDGNNTYGNDDDIDGSNNNTTGNNDDIDGNNNNTTGDRDNVTGDGNNTYGNDDVIDGSNDNTVGNNDEVTGDNNNTTGDRDKVTGNSNNTYGNDDTIDGSNNNTEGNNDKITGDNNTTDGNENEVKGDRNNTTGYDNTVTGDENNTYGNENKIKGTGNDTYGNENEVTGDDNINIGRNNKIDGSHSTVIGRDSYVAASNAGAIGNNAVATESDVVSFGHSAGDPDGKGGTYSDDYRVRLTNVADGINPNDAVNFGQLSNTESRLQSGVASAAALAALHPLDFDPDEKVSFAVGYGNYKSANSVAFGTFIRPNDSVMLSLGGAFGSGENTFNVGLSFKLGKKAYGKVDKRPSVSTVEILSQNEKLKAEVANLHAEIDQMKAIMKQALGIEVPDIPAPVVETPAPAAEAPKPEAPKTPALILEGSGAEFNAVPFTMED